MILLEDLVPLLFGNVGSRRPGAEDLTEADEEGVALLGSVEQGFGVNAVKHLLLEG